MGGGWATGLVGAVVPSHPQRRLPTQPRPLSLTYLSHSLTPFVFGQFPQVCQGSTSMTKEAVPVVWSRPSSHLASSDGLPPCRSLLTTATGESPPEGTVRTQIASHLAEQLIYFVYFFWQSP